LRLVPTAKTADLALYFVELCKDCIQERIKHVTIILDNNSTHKYKLHRYLWAELFTSGIEGQITVGFVYTPPYSPNFNLVEYVIHLLRLRLLHHLPSDKSIEQVEMRIKTFLKPHNCRLLSKLPTRFNIFITSFYSLLAGRE